MKRQTKPENANEQVFQDFVEFFTYTNEDLLKQPTEEQLKELCLKRKCKVLMSRWNPLDDVVRGLHRKGRLQNKSKHSANRLIVKCVNHYKPRLLYSEDEIRETLIDEWRQRKKISLLLLDLWEYERQKQQIQSQSFLHSQPMLHSQQSMPHSQPMLQSQNINQSQLITDSNEVVNAFLEINTESMLINTLDNSSQQQTEEILFTQGSQYDEFNRSVPCTSTQDNT